MTAQHRSPGVNNHRLVSTGWELSDACGNSFTFEVEYRFERAPGEVAPARDQDAMPDAVAACHSGWSFF